jgi:uncharacterized protein YdcH (DUF465 family)
MNYLPLMTDEEVLYICSVIRPQEVSSYFRRYPKDFAKIVPGFRASSIDISKIPGLLFRHRSKYFISSFIEGHINEWLPQIQHHLDKAVEEGVSLDAAYIKVLPESFFAGNVSLYFKLTEKEYPDGYLSLLSSAVAEAKDVIEGHKKLEDEIEAKNASIMRLQKELDSLSGINKSLKEKQNEYISEVKSLKQENAHAQKLTAIIQRKDDAIAALMSEIDGLRAIGKSLAAELSATKNEVIVANNDDIK